MNQNGGGSSISSPSPSSPISKKITYRKRKKTLKKKAEELSVLCGVPVGLICVDTTGKVETWPEERQKVDEILQQYMRKTTNAPETVSLRVKKKKKKKKKRKLKYESWISELDYLPEDSLVEILEYVERKEKILDERILDNHDEIRGRLGLGFQILNS